MSNADSPAPGASGFVRFAIFVLLACVVIVAGAWSFSKYREAVNTDRLVDESLRLLDDARASQPANTGPDEPDNDPPKPKPLTEYTDDEKNLLWWEIAESCKTENFVPDGQHTIDTYKLRPIADRLGIQLGDLSSFWRSGESADWRTIERPR